MDFAVSRYNEIVKKYDYCLYAERMATGIIHIYRRHASKLGPTQFVFAITDNWQATGKPVEWGELPIRCRLRVIDAMNNPDMFEDIVASYKRREESEDKERRNTFEAMAADMYPAFKKTFYDTNRTGLAKETRRMKMEN